MLNHPRIPWGKQGWVVRALLASTPKNVGESWSWEAPACGASHASIDCCRVVQVGALQPTGAGRLIQADSHRTARPLQEKCADMLAFSLWGVFAGTSQTPARGHTAWSPRFWSKGAQLFLTHSSHSQTVG